MRRALKMLQSVKVSLGQTICPRRRQLDADISCSHLANGTERLTDGRMDLSMHKKERETWPDVELTSGQLSSELVEALTRVQAGVT